MKNRWFNLLVCLLLGFGTAMADLPFRNHRYDGFKVLKPMGNDNIVFIGNSITNMHEWWESFGDNRILARGVSGAVSDEVLANMGSLINGTPGKVFLMIGTNDLGTSGINNANHVASNTREIVDYIRKASPSTEIYIQSILPSSLRNEALQIETNDSLRKICTEMHATYVDLWDALYPIKNGDRTYTYDGLHLTGAAYRIWCKAIEKYVGLDTTYPEQAEAMDGGMNGSPGMRVTSFGMLPVHAGDILLIGDEMIHGGEWHELLGSDRVKNRGNGWGYPGPGIANITGSIPAILKGRADNGEPAKIFLYAGVADANGSDDISTIKTRYEALVKAVRDNAPNAEIYIQALLPKDNANQNSTRVVPLNTELKNIADANDNVFYIDDYTPMVKDGVADNTYFNGNYVYGKGYAKLAAILAEYMGDGITAASEEEAADMYDRLTARNYIGSAPKAFQAFTFGDGPGKYPADKQAEISELLTRGYAAIYNSDITTAELTTLENEISRAMTQLYESINLPLESTEGDEHWYKFYTPQRGNKYLSSKGAGNNVIGEDDANYARSMWKLVKRTDGSYDLVNRADKSYLSPESGFNTAIRTVATQPNAGWTLSYSNTPGTYIISSNTVQINQTQAGQGFAVFNWSADKSGTDRNDTGCRYAIMEAGDPTPEVSAEPVVTLTNITLDGTTPYKFADDQANTVFGLDQMTVAIDFTLDSTPNGTMQALIASSNSNSNALLSFGIYGSNVVRAYTSPTGFYSSDNTAIGTDRHQLVITLVKGTKYTYYKDGAKLRDVVFNAPVFGSLDGVNGLYLGGLMSADNTASQLANGKVHSIRFYDHVLSATEISELTYPEISEDGAILVKSSTGTLLNRDGGTTGNFFATWTSNETTPTLTLNSNGKNNMNKQGDDLVGYVGSNVDNCPYTLSVPEGYIIKAWAMDICQPNGSTNAVNVVAGGKTYTTTANDQAVSVSGLTERTATFTLRGGNHGVVFKNFRVWVEESETQPEPRFDIFVYDNNTDNVMSRIPAIAAAQNGNVIAVSDYRYSGADIGMSSAADGKIDLRYRVSKDNGKTWGDILTLAQAKGYAYGQATKDSLNAAFGDPCIVADRESSRVLVMSCSGMVSFPNGTRSNHQGIARMYSEDNGETWSAATDISGPIYAQFDKRNDGPVRAMFVGSGKISQSNIIKVGDYYRLYCAVLTKLNSGSNVNFVLYSDDFGGNWTVLGDVNVTPIPGGGDEPKADELPDGSVIISSRATGGRFFNIYRYSDSRTGAGYWEENAFSGQGNNGTAALGNSCNGEIMFVPVVRNSDNKKMYLALQSVPFGPGGRNNVGIYYKGIESPADYANPATFAAEWEGRHQASSIGSAYSTMTLQKDNSIGFLFEESTYGRDYTIVYKNYTIDFLTNDRYSYDTAADREAFAYPVTLLDATMEEIPNMVGTNVGNLTETAVASIREAHNVYKAAPSQQTYEAFTAAFTNAETVAVNPNILYRLRNSDRQNGTLYMVANANELTAATLNEEDGTQTFQLIPDEANKTYLLYNAESNVYIGRTGANETKIPVVTGVDEASYYSIASDHYGKSSLSCMNPQDKPAIHLAGDCKRLVPWNAVGSPASLWYIEPTDLTTDIERAGITTTEEVNAPIYDLSGRRVLNPGAGIYIRSGRKFIKR